MLFRLSLYFVEGQIDLSQKLLVNNQLRIEKM